LELVKLKRAKIRGVESYSMVCSEKELGISEEHEDIIYLDEDAPVGTPLVDYMGDAVLTIAITPNIARDANIIGVAREVAVLTGVELRLPSYDFHPAGPEIAGKVRIDIQKPELNPRFVLGLIQDIEIKPSPYWVRRRLQLAGMRPINNIVDATNYAMLEVGEPLHAFDYDVLVQRANGKTPVIITRAANPGEILKTLDNVDRKLNDFTVMVTDNAGALSIAGIMGGAESEVTEKTRNILLEGATWNFINIRKTVQVQHLDSEAAYRFSRGVHPAMAPRGVSRGLELMRQWSGGVVSKGLIDNYPLPAKDPTVEVTSSDVRRWLGIELTRDQIAGILRSLEFKIEIKGETIQATTPDHRLDIGEGVIGKADVLEEIARIYGYDRIPQTRIADALPPQRGNPSLELEEKIKDLLVRAGLQEVMTYRLTSPAKEARMLPKGEEMPGRYAYLANPISAERTVMRRSLLSGVMESLERNARIRKRMALFEVGPVFLPLEKFDVENSAYCSEPARAAIVMSGPRALQGWQAADITPMDFYDLKGVIETLLDGLRITNVRYEAAEHPSFHPGKCARIWVGAENTTFGKDLTGYYDLGIMGELHPIIRDNFDDIPETPILAADLDISVLKTVVPPLYVLKPVPAFPPILEDLAFVVDESLPANQVADLISQTGGNLISDVRLFDVYRGEKIGTGRKSLAYSITYQAADKTLTDEQVAKVRNRIIQKLEKELGAQLRA
ncbi:MAG: phenylalanine--tRNA ligase subunit beta, partial [Chloroflexota bacterium]